VPPPRRDGIGERIAGRGTPVDAAAAAAANGYVAGWLDTLLVTKPTLTAAAAFVLCGL
jgi:hypothetical protein